MRRSVIFDFTVELITQSVLLLALYFLFAGHNEPGGGFIGGLVAGGALALRELAGMPPPGLLRRVDPLALMGVGLVLAAGTGMAAWLFDAPFLTSDKLQLELPVLGTVKLFSVLAFDTGVLLVVVGLVLAELAALGPTGDEPGADPEEQP